MMILLLLAILDFSEAAETSILFEMTKSKPGISETFRLESIGDQEVLYSSSNRFFLNKKEFGYYSRPHTSIKKQLQSILISQPRHTLNTLSPHDWKITIFGRKIDVTNARYGDFLSLVKKIMQSSNWQKKEVTSFQMGQQIQLRQWKENTLVSENNIFFFDICKTTYEERPICETSDGFIFLK